MPGVSSHQTVMCKACRPSIVLVMQGEAGRAAEFTHNPLLAPLVREDSYSVQDVAVAAAEVPHGSYYVPQGAQYVQVS